MCCAVLQENELLQKQNELLRSSEAAYQQEAQLVGADQGFAGVPTALGPSPLHHLHLHAVRSVSLDGLL